MGQDGKGKEERITVEGRRQRVGGKGVEKRKKKIVSLRVTMKVYLQSNNAHYL